MPLAGREAATLIEPIPDTGILATVSPDPLETGTLRGEGSSPSHVVLAEHLRRRVELRLIQPGDSLPSERELMRIFSAGRGTVQKALAMLAREGVVIKRRGRSGGAFVTDAVDGQESLERAFARVCADRRRIEEALNYRLQIEPGIVAEACRDRSDEGLHVIRDAQRNLTAAETVAQYMRFDHEFHLAIAAASNNRFLDRAALEIRTTLNDAFWVLTDSPMWLGRIVAEHDLILAAIESRDAARGQRAAYAHVERTNADVRALLASAPPIAAD
jgi:DNA-binding FadR family transcriptional regulator